MSRPTKKELRELAAFDRMWARHEERERKLMEKYQKRGKARLKRLNNPGGGKVSVNTITDDQLIELMREAAALVRAKFPFVGVLTHLAEKHNVPENDLQPLLLQGRHYFQYIQSQALRDAIADNRDSPKPIPIG